MAWSVAISQAHKVLARLPRGWVWSAGWNQEMVDKRGGGASVRCVRMRTSISARASSPRPHCIGHSLVPGSLPCFQCCTGRGYTTTRLLTLLVYYSLRSSMYCAMMHACMQSKPELGSHKLVLNLSTSSHAYAVRFWRHVHGHDMVAWWQSIKSGVPTHC